MMSRRVRRDHARRGGARARGDVRASSRNSSSPAIFIPAIGQGILAAQARRDRDEVVKMLRAIQHAPTVIAADAEQAFSAVIEGGCKTPIGCYARVERQCSFNGRLHTECRRHEGTQEVGERVRSAQRRQVAEDLARALLK